MPVFQVDLDLPCLEQQQTFGHGQHEQPGRNQQQPDMVMEACHGERRKSPGEALSSSPTKAVLAAVDDTSLGISDRVKLIERIKRGESPTWLPNGTLEGYFRDLSKPPTKPPDAHDGSPEALGRYASAESRDPTQPSPPPELKLHAAADIERPRSALHSGDFTQEVPFRQGQPQPELPLDGNSHQVLRQSQSVSSGTSWPVRIAERPFDPWKSYSNSPETPLGPRRAVPSASSPPSAGLFPSNYVLTLATSPLAHTFTQPDAEPMPGSEQNEAPVGRSQGSRRHTLPPNSLHSLQPPPSGQLPTYRHVEQAPPSKAIGNAPYQGHFARRSFTSNVPSYIHGSRFPPTPPRIRRPSLSSEVPSLHHASMVGSYEESILRGRMSTAPSKPLDFVAQIGVLGLGNCKPQLRCPAHVSVPFPAVFYSYSKTNVERSPLEEGPSPYVGLIDLEHSLAKPERIDGEDRRRRHRICVSGNCSSHEGHEDGARVQPGLSNNERRLRRKKNRRSSSPKAPPGGSYRIPQKGQLQIVIKNPNKTAVKLFLVPYDLEGMEPGTKTFIRQRSYSTGPILELALRSTTNTDATKVVRERPTLRYLIHLHICCPSRGRFFLYKSIRVVFANRVPDGKEHLRNEIQLPEPRYSVYKPGRDSVHAGTASAMSAAFRRRSSGFGIGFGAEAYDAVDGIGHSMPLGGATLSSLNRIGSQPGPASRPLSFASMENPHSPSDDLNPRENDPNPYQPPGAALRASPGRQTQRYRLYPHHPNFQFPAEPAADEMDFNGTEADHAPQSQLLFENVLLGAPLRPAVEVGEGLLAQRLRSLDVQRHPDQQNGYR